MCNRDRTHNGWTNYETWVVNLWMDNEQHVQRYWEHEARTAKTKENPVFWLADRIKEEHEAACQQMLDDSVHYKVGPFADLLNGALSEVNWDEIARHWIDAYGEDE